MTNEKLNVEVTVDLVNRTISAQVWREGQRPVFLTDCPVTGPDADLNIEAEQTKVTIEVLCADAYDFVTAVMGPFAPDIYITAAYFAATSKYLAGIKQNG